MGSFLSDLKQNIMTKKELKQELLNSSVEIDLQGYGKADVIFERDFDNLIDKLAKKLPIYSVSVSFLYEFVNEFTDTEIPKEAIKETLDKLNER